MENLIRQRLVENEELVKILAKFGDEPAVFYQKSELRQDFSADEISGQISIDVTFGVLRKPNYAHILVGTNFSDLGNDKFLTKNFVSADKNETADNFETAESIAVAEKNRKCTQSKKLQRRRKNCSG